MQPLARPACLILGLSMIASILPAASAQRAEGPVPAALIDAWPRTDLAGAEFNGMKLMVKGGRNPMPPLNAPGFIPLDLATHVGQLAPVIAIEVDGQSRVYPLHIVAAHGVVNDEVAGVPVAVSYCRVCASPMVFRRVVAGEPTRLGLTGVAYEDNLVLYDEASETWWQQINGLGLAGKHKDDELAVIPSRLTSLQQARQAAGGSALVLAHSDYSRGRVLPKLDLDAPATDPLYVNLNPTERVIVVGDQAYRLADIAARGEVRDGDLILRHSPGRLSGPDAFSDPRGIDVGNVDVLRSADGGARVSPEAYRINLGHALDNLRKGRVRLRDLEPIGDPYAPDKRVTRDK